MGWGGRGKGKGKQKEREGDSRMERKVERGGEVKKVSRDLATRFTFLEPPWHI